MPSDTQRLNWLRDNSDKILLYEGRDVDGNEMPNIWYRLKDRTDIDGVLHIGPYTNFRYVIDAAMNDEQ